MRRHLCAVVLVLAKELQRDSSIVRYSPRSLALCRSASTFILSERWNSTSSACHNVVGLLPLWKTEATASCEHCSVIWCILSCSRRHTLGQGLCYLLTLLFRSISNTLYNMSYLRCAHLFCCNVSTLRTYHISCRSLPGKTASIHHIRFVTGITRSYKI